jgi:hypothetical protein
MKTFGYGLIGSGFMGEVPCLCNAKTLRAFSICLLNLASR